REVRRTFRNKYDLLTAMIESQDNESATAALAELLQYDTLNNFGSALVTYRRLEVSGVDVTSMAGAVERILALQLDDTAFIQQGEANEFGIWRQRLLKPGVYIESTQGAIREVRFTCDRKHQAFLHQEGVEYTTPDSWGSCGIEI